MEPVPLASRVDPRNDGLPRDPRSIVRYLQRENIDPGVRDLLTNRLREFARGTARDIMYPPPHDVGESVTLMLHRMYLNSARTLLGEQFAPYLTEEDRSLLLVAVASAAD